jgi:ribosomal protein S27AE
MFLIVSYAKFYNRNWRTFIQVDRFFPSSKLCYRCGYDNVDLTPHDRTWCCPACGETHDRDVNTSKNLYFVGIGRPEVTYFEQALVKNRSHPATKQETQPLTVEQPAALPYILEGYRFILNVVAIAIVKPVIASRFIRVLFNVYFCYYTILYFEVHDSLTYRHKAVSVF